MSETQNIFNTDIIESDLKLTSIKGGFLTLISQLIRFILQISSTFILARLLTPKDYGLYGMVLAITGFIFLFKDIGLTMATIQSPQINHDQVNSLFWINAGMGLIMTVFLIAISPLIACFYNNDNLTKITIVLSFSFIFIGFSAQHDALLKRQMKFLQIGLIEIFSMTVGVFVAITLAFYKYGFWALVFMNLSTTLTAAVGYWIFCKWRPTLPKLTKGIRKLLSFGTNLTGFNILNYFARNLDNILIGRYLGAIQLGYYSRAYQLLLLPIQQINNPITSVAIPALSRLQGDPERFSRYYCKAINIIAFVTFPLIVSLAALSNETIKIILGDQWLASSDIFKVLAIAAIFQTLANTTGWIYISLGQTHRMFKWAIISVPLIIISFIIGIPWGAIGVAKSYTACIIILTLPSFLFAFRYSPVKISDLFHSIKRPFTISVVLYLTIFSTKHYLPFESAFLIALTSFSSGIFVSTLFILLWPKARYEITHIYGHLKELKASFI